MNQFITKTILSLSILLCYIQYIDAQVGINTNNVGAYTLYIEGGNTTSANDDVVISNTGNVGIGTNAPTSKLHVSNGTLLYEDQTTNYTNRSLVSDANGVASWNLLSFAKKTSIWTLSGAVTMNQINTSGQSVQFAGTSTIGTPNEVGLSLGASSSVTVPKGRYLIRIDGDIININEYLFFYVKNADTGANFYTTLYFYYLSGSSFIYTFSNNTRISIWAASAVYGSRPLIKTNTGASFYPPIPYTGNYYYKLTFLLLE